ncbi:MAG TPA: hypothetical protein VN578_12080, partial [Candidatus Binatia bacterium]|nr:hypothetical protein [Candidatus Binatia bacterium]
FECWRKRLGLHYKAFLKRNRLISTENNEFTSRKFSKTRSSCESQARQERASAFPFAWPEPLGNGLGVEAWAFPGAWSLDFGVSLVFGVWCFDLGLSDRTEHFPLLFV